MEFLLVIIFFVGGGWLLGKLVQIIFFSKKNEDDFYSTEYKEPNTTINNYITENHLHISKEDLKSLTEKSNPQ